MDETSSLKKITSAWKLYEQTIIVKTARSIDNSKNETLLKVSGSNT